MEAGNSLYEYVVTFALTVANRAKLTPSVDRTIRHSVSLFELSSQDKSIRLAETAVARRFDGAAGAATAVAVGVGVAVAVGLDVGVGVGAGLGGGVGVAVAVGVGLGVGV